MKRLEALEGLRGYAAFLVFLTHAFGLVIQKLYAIDPDHFSIYAGADPAVIVLMLLFRSHYGVDLFFVLSGLLMADIAMRRWPGTRAFLARRALRVYPAYLASVAIVAAAVVLASGPWPSALDVAANTAFLQGFFVLAIPAINPVTWSLSYEAVFYLAVPALAVAWSVRKPQAESRATWAALAAAFAVIVAASALLPGEKTIFFAYFALFVPGIFLGMLDAEARGALARRLPDALAIAAWIAFALAVKLEWVSNRDAPYYVASGIACGLVVLKACDRESALARLLTRRAPLWLGRHSYSFFLIHYVVLHAYAMALDSVMDVANRWTFGIALVAGGLALSLAAARILYVIAERFYFARR